MPGTEIPPPIESFSLSVDHLGGQPPVYQVNWEIVKYTEESEDVVTSGERAFVIRPGQAVPKVMLMALLSWLKSQI